MRTRPNSALRAFTLIELIVVMSIIVVLAFVLIPGVVNARQKAQRIRCVSYLKQIGISFRLWSADNANAYPMAQPTNAQGTLEVAKDVWRTFRVMSNELSTPFILACLSDSRSPAADFSSMANSNISYFIGLDADESMPDLILGGDRHLTGSRPALNKILTFQTNETALWAGSLHQGGGNVALADASVQQWTGAKLNEGIAKALRLNREVRTNATLRLAMPE